MIVVEMAKTYDKEGQNLGRSRSVQASMDQENRLCRPCKFGFEDRIRKLKETMSNEPLLVHRSSLIVPTPSQVN